MKKFSWLLIVLLILDIGLLLVANRGKLTETYDAQYWKDRYDHSQWQLPLSTRTIGDDGLYAYEGYKFIGGADPTAYNAEIPPLGRYVIGAVIRLTGVSAWYGVISSLIAVVLFYLLANKILKDKIFALIATTLLSFDLLFISQWTVTMLDTLQLAALLLFFILLAGSPVLAGVALGIFSAIKYPIFSIILLAGGGLYIWKKSRSVSSILVFGACTIGTYMLSYIQYFLLGHSLVDWLRLQKYMFAFWKGSTLAPNTGSIWITLLANHYQNLFSRLWETVPEWSLSWPVIIILNGYLAFRFLKQKPRHLHAWLVTVWFSVFLFMMFYTFVPFWTRYLLLIVPFLYVGAMAAIKTIPSKRVIIIITLAILAFNAYTGWHGIFPTPESDVKQFVYDWKNGFYQDMYERFTTDAKTTSDRYTFLRTMQQATRDGEIETTNISILSLSWNQFTSPQDISLKVTYETRNLGEFSENISLPVVLENGRWRIPWKPEYFLSGFTQGDSLKTTVVPGNRGTITDRTGAVLARDFPSLMIWITPKLVDTKRETEMLKYLETLFGYPRFSAVNFYHRYGVNSQPDWPVSIAILSRPPDDKTVTLLAAYPGITLTPSTGRYEAPTAGLVGNTHYFECCSYLYSTTAYDGISGPEETYNARLKGKNGGSLVIVDSTGNIIRTLINTEKKDGENVSL